MREIFGVTGGTGCGKTTFLKVLEEQGFLPIDCDALYHDLVRENAAMLAAIGAAFPGTVVGGSLQRKALGQIVFADPAALKTLSAITDPFVDAAVEALLAAHPAQNAAIDAIRLFESGIARRCSRTFAVTAPVETRVKRLMAREGISEDYARLRIAAQPSDETFQAKCDTVLVNDFPTKEDFAAYCRTVLKSLPLRGGGIGASR